MHLTIITVCRDMADYLAITLPKNLPHADEMAIVSAASDDAAVHQLAARGGAASWRCVDLSCRIGFPKSKALNYAFAMAQKHIEPLDCILLLDADMILPPDFREKLEAIPKDSNTIYGVTRYDQTAEDYIKHEEWHVDGSHAGHFCPPELVTNRKDIGVGAFQLFHASARCLRKLKKWYPETSDDATRDDRLFVRQWPTNKRDTAGGTAIAKELEGIHPIHIGPLGENHRGRVSPMIKHPGIYVGPGDENRYDGQTGEPLSPQAAKVLVPAWTKDEELRYVDAIQKNPTDIPTPYDRGVIYLINETNAFNIRLAVSIWSLRRHYDGWVTILINEGGCVEADEIERIANAWDCDVDTFPYSGKKRKESLQIKTRVHELTPYECTVFLDADTLIRGNIVSLFESAEDHHNGMVFTDWGWVCGGHKMQKRIRPWVDGGFFKQPNPEDSAVNTGVFAFRKDSPVMPEWSKRCHEGMKTINDFYSDEICGNLIALEMGAVIMSPNWNRSCLERDQDKLNSSRIIHYHGRKHVRKVWLEPEDTRRPASIMWCEAFEECVKDHPWVPDLSRDKHTAFYLKWRTPVAAAETVPDDTSAPPFPKSNLAPTDAELSWLAKLAADHKPRHILELGAGITTWIIDRNTAADTYTIVEGVPDATDPKHQGFRVNVEGVKTSVPRAKWQDHWDYGDAEYDFLFLDSSAGGPRTHGLQRLGALKAAEPNLVPGALVCVHDWHGRSGKAVVAYIESSECYRTIGQLRGRTGIGAAIYEPAGRTLPAGELGEPITDFSEITLTLVASSQHHAERARATLDSFRKMKGFNGPTVLFVPRRFDPLPDFTDRTFVVDYNGRDEREECLAAFVFGAKYVDTRYCLKLDAAMYCTDRSPFLFEGMLEYELVAMPWGYTRGAQMIRMFDYWLDGHVKAGRVPMGDFQGVEGQYPYTGDEAKPWRTKHKARRIISRVRLARTGMLQTFADLCEHGNRRTITRARDGERFVIEEPGLNRLPIPSEDTSLWRFCERLRLPWLTFRFGECGIAHDKKILKVRESNPEYFA